MSKIREDIDKIDAGVADSLAFQRIRDYLLHEKNLGSDLYNAVSVYLESAPIVDWRVSLKYVRYPECPLIAAAVISATALRNCLDQDFWRIVGDVASGEEWDNADDARIQAILTLARNPYVCNDMTKRILCAALQDHSATIRDSAAIAAQRCFGTPENEVLAGGELGKLSERLSKPVLKWLGCK